MIKLIKYELKAVASDFYGIMIAVFALAIIGPFLINFQNMGEWLIAIFVLVGMGTLIALGIITIIVILKIFNKRLYSNIGYLQFSLPVTSTQLLASKVASAFIIQTAIGVLTFVAMVIFSVILSLISSNGLEVLSYFWDLLFVSNLSESVINFTLLIIPFGLANWLYTIMLLLFVVTFVHTSYVRKNRLIVAVVLYIGLAVVFSSIQGLFLQGDFIQITTSRMVPIIGFQDPITFGNMIQNELLTTLNLGVYLFTMAYYVILAGLLFSGSQYLVDRKLELE